MTFLYLIAFIRTWFLLLSIFSLMKRKPLRWIFKYGYSIIKKSTYLLLTNKKLQHIIFVRWYQSIFSSKI